MPQEHSNLHLRVCLQVQPDIQVLGAVGVSPSGTHLGLGAGPVGNLCAECPKYDDMPRFTGVGKCLSGVRS